MKWTFSTDASRATMAIANQLLGEVLGITKLAEHHFFDEIFMEKGELRKKVVCNANGINLPQIQFVIQKVGGKWRMQDAYINRPQDWRGLNEIQFVRALYDSLTGNFDSFQTLYCGAEKDAPFKLLKKWGLYDEKAKMHAINWSWELKQRVNGGYNDLLEEFIDVGLSEGYLQQLIKGKRVLEAGAGIGNLLLDLHNKGIMAEGFDVWYMDHSSEIDESLEDYLFAADATDLSFQGQEFDTLLDVHGPLSFALNNSELRQMLSEYLRVLKVGGKILKTRVVMSMDAKTIVNFPSEHWPESREILQVMEDKKLIEVDYYARNTQTRIPLDTCDAAYQTQGIMIITKLK